MHRTLAAIALLVPAAFGAPRALAVVKTPVPQKRAAVPQFPADVRARGEKLWAAASPAAKAWTGQHESPIVQGTGDPETMARAAVQARWPHLRPAGSDAMTFLAIYEAAKSDQGTLKNKLDSMSELGETESLRLQMAMDRLSKMMTTLSNLLKKISDTADGIVQGLK